MGTRAIHLRQRYSGVRTRRDAGVCLPLTLAGATLGLLSLLPATPALVWNHTGSVPVGLYSLDRSSPAKGDIVAIAPHGKLLATLEDHGVLPANRLLLKELAAANGQTVCRNQTVVSIDGVRAAVARPATSDGRALPVWSGCRVLAADEVLVLNPHAGSFDSRYYGPIDASQIVGVAHPLLTFSSQEAP